MITETCQGFSLLLECSAEGEGSTVFQGNPLNCISSNNEITLLHSRFNTDTGNNTTCNDGKILGYSLPVDNSSNCYISQLCIMVTPDMIGKTIRCAYDDGTTATEIGNFSIERMQCHTMTVTTISPTTGKPLIHEGALITENCINFIQQFQCLYGQQPQFTKTSLNLVQLCTHVTKVHDIVYLTA